MKNNQYLKVVILGFIGFLLIVALIFALASRLDYWQGWVFSLIYGILLLVLFIAFANKPGVIRERAKLIPAGTKWWDKIFYAFYIPMFFATIIIAAIDARFGWTAQLPAAVYITSYMVHIFSWFIAYWAMWVNEFFFRTVRIQAGQKVVQSGPYSFVRHPGYVGGILMAPSTALILGSLWALIPAAGVVVLLIVRTYLEDSTLQKELPGYIKYTKKVRYRLLPGAW